MIDPDDKDSRQSTPGDAAAAAPIAAAESRATTPPPQARGMRTKRSKARGRRKSRRGPRAGARAKSSRRAAAAHRQPRVSGRFTVTPQVGESPNRPISSFADLQKWLERRRGHR